MRIKKLTNRYWIAEDGSYVRDKETGEKLIPRLSCGYRRVTIPGYPGRMLISRLMWTAWNGPIPKGYEIHHKDENILNDYIDNLQMLTKSEHSSLHMTKDNPSRGMIGEKCHHAKMTEQKIVEVKRLSYVDELTQWDIAQKFKVSKSCINDILNGYNKWNKKNLSAKQIKENFFKNNPLLQ